MSKPQIFGAHTACKYRHAPNLLLILSRWTKLNPSLRTIIQKRTKSGPVIVSGMKHYVPDEENGVKSVEGAEVLPAKISHCLMQAHATENEDSLVP